MLSSKFKNKQDSLFAKYYWVGFFCWSLAGLAIFIASLTPPSNSVGSSSEKYGATLLWAGIIILLLSAIYRYFLKSMIQKNFWREYARIMQGTTADITNHFHQVLAGPVVSDNASKVQIQKLVTGQYKNHPVSLQEVRVTYEKDIPGKDNATFSVRYIIQAVKLPARVPHIFIASKQNKKKKLSGASNLWSLTTKLDSAQKLQELEGNFGKYFEVYTTHQETDGLIFKKENDALRVLTPDVMIALRDDGFNFDYELHENYLYVIHEPDILTASGLENFILSLEAALSEVLPQVTGHKFTDDGRKLHIRKAALTMDILFGPIIMPAKLAFIFLSILFLGAFIGDLQ